MKKRIHFSCLILFCFVSALISNIGTSQTPDSTSCWPTNGWNHSTPEEQGMDSEILARAFDFIRMQNINIHSLHIVRNGYAVLDSYFYPYPESSVHDSASVTKSIVSVLVGIAIDKGFLSSVDVPLTRLFPEHEFMSLDANKKKLTIKNLLTMTSGYDCRYQGGERQLMDMRKSNDWVRYMLDMPVIHEPGTRFSYCSGNFHLLAGIISKTTRLCPKEFAQKHLFTPLGIKESIWPTDPKGINFGWGDLHLHPKDMAKIGYLFLKKGRWKNIQIVSSRWVRQSTQIHTRSSDNEYYGLSWWIRPTPEPGIYEALGRGGQRIIVWPAKNIVVVFTGGGFEPGDIGGFIVDSVRSDKPLSENTWAYATLMKKVKTAASPPEPKPLDALPEIIADIEGKEYLLDHNPFGFESIVLFFPNKNTGNLKIYGENSMLEIPFGLDDTYRLSPTGELGLPRASKGKWLNQNTLVLYLYQVARMDTDELTLSFEGKKLALDIDGTLLEGKHK